MKTKFTVSQFQPYHVYCNNNKADDFVLAYCDSEHDAKKLTAALNSLPIETQADLGVSFYPRRKKPGFKYAKDKLVRFATSSPILT